MNFFHFDQVKPDVQEWLMQNWENLCAAKLLISGMQRRGIVEMDALQNVKSLETFTVLDVVKLDIEVMEPIVDLEKC